MAFLHLIDPQKKLRELLTSFRRMTVTERIHIYDGLGRILAEDIKAHEDIPPLPRSTVDGYAVIAEDTTGASEATPALLKLVGRLEIGSIPELEIRPGECAYIPTGGILPKGSNGVVMLEYTDESAGFVEVFRGIAPGENTVQPGEDIKQGLLLIPAGTRLHERHIGLLAYTGITEINAYKKPTIKIFSTGNEVIPPDQTPKPGQVRDANGPMLMAMFGNLGKVTREIAIIPDSEEKLTKAIENSDEDVIIFSGGSSAGVSDHVEAAIRNAGGRILAHGLTIKPGKPTLIGEVEGKPIIGLPGHPASCFVSAKLVAEPIIQWISGENTLKPAVFIRGIVASDIPSRAGIEEYIRVKIDFSGGIPMVTPLYTQSGIVFTLAQADGLARIPPEKEGLERGEEIEVMLL